MNDLRWAFTVLVFWFVGYLTGYARARRNARLLVRGQFGEKTERRIFDA